MNTNDFARGLGIQTQSLRARYCRTGSYFGILPASLPNGRLIWPDDAIEQLKAQGGRRKTERQSAESVAAQ